MSTALELRNLIRSGFLRIGQILFQTDVYGYPYVICHYEDAELSTEPAFGGLDVYHGPEAAREISTYAEDGAYRFTKGQTNLKRGWVMTLENEEDLRQAVDQFYPACLGLFLAQRDGTLDVQNLRDKLNRQTGMYRFARTVSDAGAQQLVQTICGPAHQCAKRILWKIDENTPLDDSEASRFKGIVGDLPETEAIPLLCREACNHFVAECRRVAKAEFEKKDGA
jgi:sirohydrochlorin cobaltochelatase